MIDWDYLATLDFTLPWTYRQALFDGLLLTLVFFFLGGGLGFALGLAITVADRVVVRPVRWVLIVFVELFRNTPLLVQLMWIHFALPQIIGVNMSVFQSGLVAITLNVGAYMSEILRAGIDSVPRVQWDACRALGLGRYPTWRFVVLPQAIRIVLPPLANMMVSLLKGTAILSILSIAELMRATSRISTHTARPVEAFTVAAILYILVGLATVRAFAWAERRYRLRVE